MEAQRGMLTLKLKHTSYYLLHFAPPNFSWNGSFPWPLRCLASAALKPCHPFLPPFILHGCMAKYPDLQSTSTTLHPQRQPQLQLSYANCTIRQLNYTTTTTTTPPPPPPPPPQQQQQQQLWWVTWLQQPPQKNEIRLPSGPSWIRSAIHASQQRAYAMASYLWNFRHRLVAYDMTTAATIATTLHDSALHCSTLQSATLQ